MSADPCKPVPVIYFPLKRQVKAERVLSIWGVQCNKPPVFYRQDFCNELLTCGWFCRRRFWAFRNSTAVHTTRAAGRNEAARLFIITRTWTGKPFDTITRTWTGKPFDTITRTWTDKPFNTITRTWTCKPFDTITRTWTGKPFDTRGNYIFETGLLIVLVDGEST